MTKSMPKPQVRVSSSDLRTKAEEFYYYLDQIAHVTGLSKMNLRKNYIVVAGDCEAAFTKRHIRAERRGGRLVVYESEFFRWLRLHGVDPMKIDVPVRTKLYRLTEVAEKLGISEGTLRRSRKTRLYYAGIEGQEPYTPDKMLCISIGHTGHMGKESRRWRVSEEELRRYLQHTNQEVY